MTLTELIGIAAGCLGAICAVILLVMVAKQAMSKKDEYELHCPKQNVIIHNAVYSPQADALYASLDGDSLDYSYCVEGAFDGITLMWNEQGNLRGIEIYDFKQKYHSLPALVKVRCAGGTFNVVITQLTDKDVESK